MERSRFLAAAVFLLTFADGMSGQAPPKIDFEQDVLPLLRQNCVGCHGPAVQNGGLRLDRRSSAMKPFSRRIVPGNSANSFVYHRLADNQFGPQMPPTGALKPEQVATIQHWIDQGAEWPDKFANEVDRAPTNPDAVAMVEALHKGDLAGFLKSATAKPELLNARGPEGSTPFMYAVLYANATTVAQLMKMGANPNLPNDANATALMWAAHDLEKTRLLVSHGAEVNARSDDFRTPLMIAARIPGGTPVVRFLLEHGANPNPNPRPETQSSPLLDAATAGDGASFELLMQHGANIKWDAEEILTMAVVQKCRRCLDLAVAKTTYKDAYTNALQDSAFEGDAAAMRVMLDHGADPKAFDVFGHTALMYAAAADDLPLDAVKLLVARGADVNAKSQHPNSGDTGLTVLDMAKQHGKTPVVEFLVASGAKSSVAMPVVLEPRFKNELRGAIQDSIPAATARGCQFCEELRMRVVP